MPITFDVLLEYVVDDGVDVLVDVLEEEREAVLDGHLQLLQEVGVVERAHLPAERGRMRSKHTCGLRQNTFVRSVH